jgi:hypothetical protein
MPWVWLWSVTIHLTGGLPMGSSKDLNAAKADFKVAWEALKAIGAACGCQLAARVGGLEIMPTRIFAAIGGLVLLATAASAGDRIDDNDYKTILFDNGHWRTEMYAQNTKGMPMCIMIVDRKFGDRSIGQVVAMKSNAAGLLFIHISKSNWRMAANRKVPIYVSFDRDRREAVGRTIKGTNGDTIVEISVNPKIAAVESFAKAGQLTIEFREGDEQPWVDRMIDSRKAMKCKRQADAV